MQTQIIIIQTAPREWEVRAPDAHLTLLGTFYDEGSRDLFVEAVQALLPDPDGTGCRRIMRRRLEAVPAAA
jgi:hypothetical protein